MASTISHPVGRLLTVALAAAFVLAGCGRDPHFEAKVHSYLIAHPEVLEEMEVALHEKQNAQMVERAKPVIFAHTKEIFNDPRDPFVGPKNAKVTVVQFFDYRCPHCKAEAAPGVQALIKKYPDVKFVFKDLPIFGGPSVAAARTAVGVWKSNPGDYFKAYVQMMADDDLDESVNDPAGAAKMQASVEKIVSSLGLNPSVVDAAGASTDATAQLSDNQKLFAELGLDGTPAFVIGDTVVSGADMGRVEDLIKKGR
ncbi:MAG TPA: DsbA family protein [Caulobacteraceae bacterium]|jgi:protein-disulfide isomerase